MKKLFIIVILIVLTSNMRAPEFKGQTYSAPRIAEETPLPTAYDSYTPTQERIIPRAQKPVFEGLKGNKLVDDEANIRFLVDTPAMTK